MTLTRGACDSDSTKMTRTHHWLKVSIVYQQIYFTTAVVSLLTAKYRFSRLR